MHADDATSRRRDRWVTVAALIILAAAMVGIPLYMWARTAPTGVIAGARGPDGPVATAAQVANAIRTAPARCQGEYVALLQRRLLEGQPVGTGDVAAIRGLACGVLGDQLRATRL